MDADDGPTGTDLDAALTQLYRAQWAPMVRLAWLLLHDQGAAEEVAADAFVAIHPRVVDLVQRRAAAAYLRRSVVNGCRSRQRHEIVEARYRRRVEQSVDLPGRTTASSAEAEALAHVSGAALRAALATLPQRQREVLVLRYFCDLSEDDIAAALGIRAGSVKTHGHRGLAALREAVEVQR